VNKWLKVVWSSCLDIADAACVMFYLNSLCLDYLLTSKLSEICTLLRYYAAYSGNSLPTFWDNLSLLQDGEDRLSWNVITLEDGTDRLPRNSGKELQLHAV